MNSPIAEIKKNADTLLEYLETTKEIRSYDVSNELVLQITNKGYCSFVAPSPSITALDKDGKVVHQTDVSYAYMRTREMKVSELVELIESGKIEDEFNSAQEDVNDS